MRKQFTKITLAIALALTLGCEEKSPANIPSSVASTGEIKLLESSAKDDKVKTIFEYDDKNRIISILKYNGSDSNSITITYNANDSVIVKTVYSDNSVELDTFVKNGNTIKVGTTTLTIDKNGYIIKKENGENWSSTYQYKDDNLITEEDNRNHSSSYNHDNKKSPFSNTNTPKWLLLYLLNLDFYAVSKNNVVRYYHSGEVTSVGFYEYEYDSDDFPTKRMEEGDGEGEQYKSIIHFTYRIIK